MILSSLSCASWLSVCRSFLEKDLVRSSTHLIWFFVVVVLWSWAVWIVCIFCRLVSCLFHLQIFSLILWGFFFLLLLFVGFFLMVSFAVQKRLSLIRSHLFTFVFIFVTLGDGSKEILLLFMSRSVFPMFSSKFYSIWSYV